MFYSPLCCMLLGSYYGLTCWCSFSYMHAYPGFFETPELKKDFMYDFCLTWSSKIEVLLRTPPCTLVDYYILDVAATEFALLLFFLLFFCSFDHAQHGVFRSRADPRVLNSWGNNIAKVQSHNFYDSFLQFFADLTARNCAPS